MPTYSDPRDAALVNACPVVAVPRFSELRPLKSGKRYLCGHDGLYVEAASPVLRVVTPVAPSDAPLPYGETEPLIQLPEGGIPAELLRQVVEKARHRLPHEYAAVVLYEAGHYRLHEPAIRESSPGHVQYDTDYPVEAMVLDIHTHGSGCAYFSATDDQDDSLRGGTYLAGVFGRLDGPEIDAAYRVVAHGHFFPLKALPMRQ